MSEKLIENVDYYFNDKGLMVFTEKYHTKRGHCCQSGCQHCPYEFSKKVDPSIPSELQNSWKEKWDEDEEIEIYDGPIDE